MTGEIVQISLPWPLAKLSPNGRGHWTTKEAARGAAKCIGYNAACGMAKPQISPPYQVRVDVYPPDKHRHDWDNIVGRLKYYQDGICEALGIDDNQIRRAEVVMHAPIPGGAVNITLAEWREYGP